MYSDRQTLQFNKLNHQSIISVLVLLLINHYTLADSWIMQFFCAFRVKFLSGLFYSNDLHLIMSSLFINRRIIIVAMDNEKKSIPNMINFSKDLSYTVFFFDAITFWYDKTTFEAEKFLEIDKIIY